MKKKKRAKYWIVSLEIPLSDSERITGVFSSRKKAKLAVGKKVSRHETSWIDQPGHSAVGISSDRITRCNIEAFYTDHMGEINGWIEPGNFSTVVGYGSSPEMILG